MKIVKKSVGTWHMTTAEFPLSYYSSGACKEERLNNTCTFLVRIQNYSGIWQVASGTV